MPPEASIIVPVYARQLSGETAIRSAISQAGVKFEVIVVDDGSPEPFELPADIRLDERVRLIRQSNGGAAAARNRGVAEAKGDWIAFLDSDDIWLPGKLRRQLDFAVEGVGRGWPPLTSVMCGFVQEDVASGSRRERVPVQSWSPADLAAGCWFCPGTTALIPRGAFATIGPFDTRLRRLEDLDWFLRLALAGGGVATCPDVAAVVYVGQRPSVSVLDGAVSILKQKWLAGALTGDACRTNLQAYLAIEQASVRWHARDWLGFVRYMAISFRLKPRMTVPLRNWWPQQLGVAQ